MRLQVNPATTTHRVLLAPSTSGDSCVGRQQLVETRKPSKLGDAELSESRLTNFLKRPRKLQCFEWNVHKIVAWPQSGWAAEKALLIPAEAVAKLHHALTSDRAATFAAVAVELVTLLDCLIRTVDMARLKRGATSQQHARAAHPKSAWTSSFPGL